MPMSQYLVHHSQLTQPSLSTLSIPHIHRSQDTHRNQGLRPNLVTLPNLATLLNRIILHSQVTLLNQVTQCNRATLPNLVTLHSQDQMICRRNIRTSATNLHRSTPTIDQREKWKSPTYDAATEFLVAVVRTLSFFGFLGFMSLSIFQVLCY